MTVEFLCYTEEDKNGKERYFIGQREVGAQEYFECTEIYSSHNADWRDLDYYPIYMNSPN